MNLRLFTPLLVFASVIACSSPGAASKDSARGAVEPTGDTAAVTVALLSSLPPISPHPIHWDVATAVSRLQALGLGVTARADSISQTFLRVPGASLVVHSSSADSAEVLVFIYASPIAVGRDILSVNGAGPRQTIRTAWRADANLVTDNNLVAIVVTNDAALRQRVNGALQSHEVR